MSRIWFILLIVIIITISSCGGEQHPYKCTWHWYSTCVKVFEHDRLEPYTNTGTGRLCGPCKFGYKITECWSECW